MSDKSIYFVDKNKEYMQAVEKYVVNNCNRVRVTFISSTTKLLETLKTNKSRIDILLISEHMYIYELKKFDIQKIALLTEDGANEADEFLSVYKYQSGEKLLSEIVSLIDDEVHKKKFDKMSESTKVIGIYSPVGGVGKTTIAATISILTAYREKRVMYLNLEDVASTENYFKANDEENLTKLIYYLRKKTKNVQDKVSKVQQLDSKHNVYFFAPAERADDLLSMSIDEYTVLIESIRKAEQYDYVFVDFSTEISKRKKEMLNLCDKILLVLSYDENCFEKIRIYEKEIEHSTFANSIIEKTMLVLNKYLSECTMSIENVNVCGKRIEYRVSNDNTMRYRRNGDFVLDLNNIMQKDIFEILRNI